MEKHPPHHSANQRWTVNILRYDGTYFVKKDCKHVLFKPTHVEIYLGEHNVDRKMIVFPWNHIDHIEVIEQSTTSPLLERIRQNHKD